MKVGVYQFDMVFCDKEQNVKQIEHALHGKDVDIVVLPELFSTGIMFSSKEEAIAQAELIPSGPTCQRFIQISAQNQCHLIGSIIEQDGERYYNTAVVIGPDGYIGKQRKIHLPDMEKEWFSRGEDWNVFDINGVKVGVMICFDCWFPEASRMLAAQGAQIICHSANIESPLTLDIVRIRAVENAAFLICANRIGQESNRDATCHFRGESRIIAPTGQILSQAGAEEEFMIVEIDPGLGEKKQYPECRDLLGEVRIYKKAYHEV